MNRMIYRAITILAVCAITLGGYYTAEAASPLPAFPGAVGFGALTVGGRGGVVIQVTNLNDSGAGSLREAVLKTGPRIVIFKISGTIQLTQHIKIDNPYITILGQTSPGGIQLIGAGIQVRTHDVVIRGLMIRPGAGAIGTALDDRSGFVIHNDRNSTQPYNIVFDHNSIEWGVDEIAATWLPVHDVTFSNNIMAEGLNCAGHPDGCHSMGLLIGTGAQRVTLYGNLFANNDWRNPILQDNTSTEIYNNVLYSWKAGSIIIQGTGGGANFTNIVGNFTKATSCSMNKGVLLDSADAGSKVYLDDWANVKGSKSLIDLVKSTTPAFAGSGIQAMSAAQAYEYVLLYSGARNDAADTRIKNNVRNGTLPNGKCLIDSPNEVGGWPTLSGTAPADADNDGLPDSFESAHGENLSATGYAPSGYTWIEEYANNFSNLPFFTTFVDVLSTNPYYDDIEILYAKGLTGGCSTTPLNFCPEMIMDRAQTAVFVLRGNFGSAYTPSDAEHIYEDNWSQASWAENWAEAMYRTGLTSGCIAAPLKFCPYDKLTRAQVVVFGLRLKYGDSYIPPAATGKVFADITDPNNWAAAWAEKAYTDGIIPACGTAESGKPLFCANDLVSRGFGAHVIVKAKNLTMP